jgi:hypothetical protein
MIDLTEHPDFKSTTSRPVSLAAMTGKTGSTFRASRPTCRRLVDLGRLVVALHALVGRLASLCQPNQPC